MSSSKKTIFFTACASVVLLVLTYLVTVNIEAGFITINSIWLSNIFFLAFFGGDDQVGLIFQFRCQHGCCAAV